MGKRSSITAILYSLAFIILILDSKHAIIYAQQGIDVCIRTVIPSLFPMLIIAGLLNQEILGRKMPGLSWITKHTGIPDGEEFIWVLGLMGGYPLGAKLINDNCQSGNLSLENGRYMMGFCCNAGPAFIFGIVSALFQCPWASFIIFLNQIISSYFTAVLMDKEACQMSQKKSMPVSSEHFSCISSSIKAMASICSWVILFKVIIGFLDRWILWILPVSLRVFLTGLLELTNGCLALNEISSEAARYLIVNVLLTCGGICVAMQIVSVSKKTGWGNFLPGKLMQSACSLVLSCFTCPLLFPGAIPMRWQILFIIFSFAILGSTIPISKKIIAFTDKMRYNKPVCQ